MNTAVRKAVIPLAGRATRHYPASSAIAKGLFALVDGEGCSRPVIDFIVSEAISAGVERIALVVGPQQQSAYERYFSASQVEKAPPTKSATAHAARLAELAGRINYIVQPRPEGFGHAVLQARQWVGEEPFLLLLGDHVFRSKQRLSCAAQLVRAFGEHACESLVAVEPRGEHELYKYGTIRGEPIASSPRLYQVQCVREKPSAAYARKMLQTPTLPEGMYLCFGGLYVFSPMIFELLEENVRQDIRENGEIQLTSAYEKLLKRGNRCLAMELAGISFDTGTPAGYLRALRAMAAERSWSD